MGLRCVYRVAAERVENSGFEEADSVSGCAHVLKDPNTGDRNNIIARGRAVRFSSCDGSIRVYLRRRCHVNCGQISCYHEL